MLLTNIKPLRIEMMKYDLSSKRAVNTINTEDEI